MNNGPIGIFDSGIGGLTVVREFMRQIPLETVVYFGDTARVPYGSKSPETVIRFSMEDASFLLSKNVKLLVVACNTACSVSLPALRQFSPVPVTGVIEPGAAAAAAATKTGVVGVIGTQGTISSGAYQKALRSFPSVRTVLAQPCPLLVPLVEEGWLDHPATRAIVSEYVRPLAEAGVDTLVLGCTHYPLLKPVLEEILGPGVALVDSAETAAAAASDLLAGKGLLSAGGTGGASFFVSDIPLKFQEIAQRFLGRSIPLVTQVDAGDFAAKNQSRQG
jgi:glutamate racemase